jgi:hypothetical protein
MQLDNFLKHIREAEVKIKGGQEAGKLEIDSTPLAKAREFAEKKGFNLDEEIPNFNENYKKAQSLSKLGKTKRKDMPVINDDDVKKFQARLEKGTIDINKPFAKDPDVGKNPFPEGLSGLKAKKWLEKGLRDGSKTDDIIDVTITKVPVSKLKPIQRQIYYDKSMGETIKQGVKNSINFVTNKSFFIISGDNYIIDGHHRYLSALLLDPKAKVNALKIELPIRKLLPMATAYGDAIGNKRNL